MAYLDYMGLHGTLADKMVDGGKCETERPDRVFELADRVIIVECDESQHKERACVCKQTRMVNERYMTAIMRWYTGDNRGAVVQFLKKLTDEIAQFMESDTLLTDETKNRLSQLLPSYRTGLDCIRMTYSMDRIIHQFA